jgi:hypothetical protein
MGITHCERKPLTPHWRHRASLGSIGRDKISVWQESTPLATDLNQIRSICAITMKKNDQLSTLTRMRLNPWTIDLRRHLFPHS